MSIHKAMKFIDIKVWHKHYSYNILNIFFVFMYIIVYYCVYIFFIILFIYKFYILFFVKYI